MKIVVILALIVKHFSGKKFYIRVSHICMFVSKFHTGFYENFSEGYSKLRSN